MPLFDFRCPHCEARFEQLVKSAERGEGVACPECGRAPVERLLSAPARPAGAGEKAASSCIPRGGFT